MKTPLFKVRLPLRVMLLHLSLILANIILIVLFFASCYCTWHSLAFVQTTFMVGIRHGATPSRVSVCVVDWLLLTLRLWMALCELPFRLPFSCISTDTGDATYFKIGRAPFAPPRIGFWFWFLFFYLFHSFCFLDKMKNKQKAKVDAVVPTNSGQRYQVSVLYFLFR